MIGIIYKFTIVSKCTWKGNRIFYVGQHWCKNPKDFLKFNYSYYGSGTMWNYYIEKLQDEVGKEKFKYFIKREILCTITNNSQKTLDKMEEFYIKKEKAHYSYERGGVNILWGTANNFGSGNPANDINIRNKQRESLKRWWKNHPEEKLKVSKRRKGKMLSLEQRNKISESLRGLMAGEKNPMWGRKASDETRRKMSIAQSKRKHRKPHSEHTKMLISETRKKYVGKNHPLYGCHYMWINNGKINKRCKEIEIPEGWVRGRVN